MRLITLSIAALFVSGCVVSRAPVASTAPVSRPVDEPPAVVLRHQAEEAADQVVVAIGKRIETGELVTPAFATLAVNWGERAVRIRSDADSQRLAAVDAYIDIARRCVNPDEDVDADPLSLQHSIATYALLTANLMTEMEKDHAPDLAISRLGPPPIDAKTARTIAAIRIGFLLRDKSDEGLGANANLIELLLSWDRKAQIRIIEEAIAARNVHVPIDDYLKDSTDMIDLSMRRLRDGEPAPAVEIAKYFQADALHPRETWQPAHDHLERDAAKQMSESALKVSDDLQRRVRLDEPLTPEFVNRCGTWSRAASLATIAANDDPSERTLTVKRHHRALEALESKVRASATENPSFDIGLQTAMVKYFLHEADLWTMRISAGEELDPVE